MLATSPLYRSLVRLGEVLAPLAGLVFPKIRAGITGRVGTLDRVARWIATTDATRPLVWLHAPSVGEGLQAEAVLTALRTSHPEWRVLYTYFSPSAERFASTLPADYTDFLPWDTRNAVAQILRMVRPTALIFVKLDLWPELATQAANAGVAVGLIAGTVSHGSSRLRWPARTLLRPGYRALSAVGAISLADAERLQRLGAIADRITVTGDPRFDSVVTKVHSFSREEATNTLGSGSILVAGSTWPADEDLLLAAYGAVRRIHPAARLVLVPHEPTTEHLARLDRMAATLRVPAPHRMTAGSSVQAPIVVVDQVGLLAALYGAGACAYVGGGFGRAGLHSVLEPAAWGLPVLMGPRWATSREAGLLLELRAAIALPLTGALPVLTTAWRGWIENPAVATEAGQRGAKVVQEGLGAAARNAELVAGLIAAAPQSPQT